MAALPADARAEPLDTVRSEEMAEPDTQPKQLGSAITNALTLLATFVGVAMVHEGSIAQIVTVTVFVVVFLLATALFHRLGGSTGSAESPHPLWVSGVLSGAVGGGLALGLEWILEYAERVGIGLTIVLAVAAAYLMSGWQQRWRERVLYRSSLQTDHDGPRANG